MASPSRPSLPIRSATIDVEEYFHIEAGHGVVDKASWDDWPSRVERNVDWLLEIYAEAGRVGTFFVLGRVAERHPAMVRRIAEAGHEIASHGYHHDRLHRLTPESFRGELDASRKLLEDQSGQRVVGYRAPTFSVMPQTRWAIDVLAESGYEYDASIFPVRHPAYGVPGAPLSPFVVRGSDEGATMLELPPLVWRAMGRHVPVAGGGYFRLLPLELMKRGLRQAAREGRSAVLYFHPWEFDPDMPRMPLKLTGRIRTYTGLKSASRKLRTILAMDGRWVRLIDVLDELRPAASEQVVSL